MKRNLIYIILLLLCFSDDAFGQKYDYNWVSGRIGPVLGLGTIFFFSDTGIVFTPLLLPVEMDRTGTGISDKDGYLQFYTNGNYIVSAKTNAIMENGGQLNAGSIYRDYQNTKRAYAQQAYFVLPDYEEDHLYYLIHSNGIGHPIWGGGYRLTYRSQELTCQKTTVPEG